MAHTPEHSATEQEIRANRLAKIDAVRAAGGDPYPNTFPDRVAVSAVRERFGGLEAGAETGESVRIAGRIMGKRGHGKAMFLDLADRSGTIQLQATLDATERYDELRDIDLGDLLGLEGDVFCSRRG